MRRPTGSRSTLFVRLQGERPRSRALDLHELQGYFARLLEKGTVAAADPSRGRFRSFLLADCSHFLAHLLSASRTNGRPPAGAAGGPCSRSTGPTPRGRYRLEPSHEQTPERLFDRDWALALLESVLEGLRGHYERTGRGSAFDVLKVVLTDGLLRFRPARPSWPPASARPRPARRSPSTKAPRRRYRDALPRRHRRDGGADESEVDDELKAPPLRRSLGGVTRESGENPRGPVWSGREFR